MRWDTRRGSRVPQGTSTYLYLGSRLIRGWAVELVLIACLLPFLATAIDLFARCRRRRIPLAPALRAYRSRLGFWAWVVGLFELFTLLGAWPHDSARPIPPTSALAHHWPAKGLLALTVLALLGWLVARERLIPRRAITLGRGARRTHRLAALPRRTLVARGCDESVRTRVPAAVAPRLALAPAGAWRATRRQARRARPRLRRPGAPARFLRRTVRIGLGRALVSRGAQGGRLRNLRRHAAPGRLARRHRTARRSRDAVVTRRTRRRPSFRPAARFARSCARPFSRCVSGAADTRRPAGSVGGLVRRPSVCSEHCSRSQGCCRSSGLCSCGSGRTRHRADTKWKQHQLAAQYVKRTQSFEPRSGKHDGDRARQHRARSEALSPELDAR